ncbi:hypothetical protein QLX08_000089 [Tetragonisca angustula]|uniref:Epoxide hydrolase n=1 Tax=Tetragonisca angustula TaxID=166442 RepID=A0AAW1ALM7_9HYME
MLKTVAVVVLFSSGLIVLFFSSKELKVPTLPETNWGSKKSGKESTEIRPFKIDVPAKILDDLKYRLAHRRTYVTPLEGVAWTYGISTKYLNTVLDYWRDNYNWSERQALLNKYPQFITNIQGLDIHFYHIKPTNLPKDKNLKVLPLLLLHGWPGSVVEFQKIIPILTKPRPNQNFVFEVIAPSLPGYGFSEGAVRPGMATAQIAVIFKNLMHRLGFEKFYIQGGDWGAAITANMAALFPEKIIGLHSNMCATLAGSTFLWSFIGTYFPSLATKPDTIGTALTASPDALAVYILEKFSTWTNTAYRERDDGGLTEKFTLDELLDNVMIYWVSNSITTSVRLYAESFSSAYRASKIEELPINVPTGCAVFPNELMSHPESLLKSRFTKLIQYSLMSRGGHFAAFEEPKLLADDIFSFVKKTEELSAAKAA